MTTCTFQMLAASTSSRGEFHARPYQMPLTDRVQRSILTSVARLSYFSATNPTWCQSNS